MIEGGGRDRKSTRLNFSHDDISYAVFCLKKELQQLYGAGAGYTVVKNPKQELVFFNDTATTEIYTLSLHDALPISVVAVSLVVAVVVADNEGGLISAAIIERVVRGVVVFVKNMVGTVPELRAIAFCDRCASLSYG